MEQINSSQVKQLSFRVKFNTADGCYEIKCSGCGLIEEGDSPDDAATNAYFEGFSVVKDLTERRHVVCSDCK